MRSFILIGFLACAIFAICEASTCTSHDDCRATECCVRMIVFNHCQKRKTEGQHCLADIEDTNNGDHYLFGCPCAEGLECKTKGGKDNGIANILTDKCVKKE